MATTVTQPARQNNGGLGAVERTVVVYVLLFSLLGVFLAIVNPRYFHEVYSMEDGLIEWLQFVALATTCYVLAKRAACLRKHKFWGFTVLSALGALAFFMVAGEEITWGQRLLDIQTTEWFLQNNAQKEMNLHNLVLDDGTKVNRILLNRIAPLFMLTYLFVLPWLYQRRSSWKSLLDKWGVPIAQFYQIMVCLLIVVLVEVVIKHLGEAPRKGELTEFGFYWVVLLIVAFPRNAQVFRNS